MSELLSQLTDTHLVELLGADVGALGEAEIDQHPLPVQVGRCHLPPIGVLELPRPSEVGLSRRALPVGLAQRSQIADETAQARPRRATLQCDRVAAPDTARPSLTCLVFCSS